MEQGVLKDNPRYGEYLEEIRQRVYALALFFTIFFLVGFLFAGRIIGFALDFLKIENVSIVTTSPFQFINLSMNIGISLALLLSMPIFLFQLYSFLRDGLNRNEKFFFFKLLPLSSLLFSVGFIYGFIIMYYAFVYIAQLNESLGIKNVWDIDRFISQIVVTSALLGLIFQFPIVLSFLIKMDVLDLKFLKSKRRLAFAVIFVGVALLPPTDGFSLVIMALPLLLIYELTILANNFRKNNYSHA